MSSLFQEKKATFFFFLALLFILIAVLYFTFMRPTTKEWQSSKSNLATLEAEIEDLRKQLTAEPDEDIRNTYELERKIPLKREMDSLLLSLQEIELVSGSRIESIQFSYESDLEEEEDSEKSEVDEDSSEEIARKLIPENLQTVTAELIVISPDYDHFMEFLKGIEQLERITFVEKLEFIKPAEAELLFIDHPNPTIAFNLQVTTFHYGRNE